MLGRSKDVKQPESRSAEPTRVSTERSTIANGMTVRGACNCDGPIGIDGTVVGDVTAAGIEVSRTGVVEGDLSSAATTSGAVVVVHGRVTGTVRAHSVRVSEGGAVLGGIDATDATVSGRVEGGVRVRTLLSMGKTATIDGEVHTSRLAMEDGARVNGAIRMGDAQKAAKPGKPPKAKPDPSPDPSRDDGPAKDGDEEGSAAA